MRPTSVLSIYALPGVGMMHLTWIWGEFCVSTSDRRDPDHAVRSTADVFEATQAVRTVVEPFFGLRWSQAHSHQGPMRWPDLNTGRCRRLCHSCDSGGYRNET